MLQEVFRAGKLLLNSVRSSKNQMIFIWWKFHEKISQNSKILTHSFPMDPFSTPLRTSENRKIFWYFQGVEKRCIGSRWVKFIISLMIPVWPTLNDVWMSDNMGFVNNLSSWKIIMISKVTATSKILWKFSSLRYYSVPDN